MSFSVPGTHSGTTSCLAAMSFHTHCAQWLQVDGSWNRHAGEPAHRGAPLPRRTECFFRSHGFLFTSVPETPQRVTGAQPKRIPLSDTQIYPSWPGPRSLIARDEERPSLGHCCDPTCMAAHAPGGGGQWEGMAGTPLSQGWGPVTTALRGKPNAGSKFLIPYLGLFRKKPLS